MASIRNVICGPCDVQNITKSAQHWCPECEEGLCNDCQKHHSSSKATIDHRIISVENYKKMPKAILDVVHHCKEHNMRHQMYCTQHDQICCPVCISTNHKKCTDLMAISELIKISKTSSLLANMEQSLQDIKNNIDQVIKNRKENLSKIKVQRQKCLDKVKKMRNKINSHLDILEQKIKNELLAAEKKVEEQIGNLLTRICKTDEEVDELQNGLLAVKEYASDLQTFFGSKAMEARVDKMEKYIKSLQEDGSLQDIKVKCTNDEKISNMLSYLTTFGSVSVKASPSLIVLKTEKEKQAQIVSAVQQHPSLKKIHDINVSFAQPSLKTIHDIKVSFASKFTNPKVYLNSDVRGCASLSNGKIMLCDCKVKRLIILNSDGSFDKEVYLLPGQIPYDVTTIHDTLVAVLSNGGINVINLNAEIPEICVKTANVCYGVTNHKGQLLWCEKLVGICTAQLSGGSITTLVKDTNLPEWSYIAACGDNIYTTNPKNKTVVCYKNTKKLWEFTNISLFRDPEGITLDNDRNIYITSFGDHKVVVISPDGKQERILLNKSDSIEKPWGIHFDKVRKTLIVASQEGTVFVYNIS